MMTAFTLVRRSALRRLATVLLISCSACEETSDSDPLSVSQGTEQKPEAQPQEAKMVEPARPLSSSSTPSSNPEPPPWASRVSPQGGFPCEVDKVLAASCRRCHFEPRENDAPFSLIKYEDIEKLRSGKPISKLMIQMVEADLMPPVDEPLEPKVTPLTPSQKQTLLDWLRDGAPRNTGECP